MKTFADHPRHGAPETEQKTSSPLPSPPREEREMEPSGEPTLEPERYELRERAAYRFELDRREFFKALGCGLVVLLLANVAPGQESGGGRRRGRGGGQRPAEISAWIHLGEDGVATVYTGKVEVGQNIRTSLAQAVAEELRMPAASVRLVMADTQLTPYDAGTFGSRTTPDMAAQLHRVGAAAREALLELAADLWKADKATLTIADGKISGDGKEPVTFGQLTKGQKLVRSVNEEARTTPPSEWRVAGTSVPKANGRDLVTGRHKYASDIQLPGMLHGKLLRPATLGAKLISLDTKPAESMPGVTVVHDGDFVGVTAPDTLLATKAIAAIRAEWKSEPQISSEELFDALKKNAPSWPTSDAPPAGEQELRRTYTAAYIAHTPLEPRAAVADWRDGKLTVWTGTQRPFGVRGELAEAFGLSESAVRVIVPDTGSGYGGKHTGEAAIEAARLAKAAGKPVKLVWTREEEFMWAYFRPAGVIEVRSRVRDDGTITAWEFHNYNSGNSGIRCPYDVPGAKTEFHPARAPLRSGSYRGLAATANHFAREMHIDELARAVKLDPLAFRLKNLPEPRLRAVLEAAAEAFGWGKSKPADGHGRGLAVGTEKGGYVATCAEVQVERENGTVRVLRAVSAFECGAVVNQDQLKNQVEGAMMMGLGGALFEAIEFANGKITNGRMSRYRVPRFTDLPKLEVVLLNRKDLPSAGAGETPIVGIAPAIGNAIFDATGKWVRSMPMKLEGRI